MEAGILKQTGVGCLGLVGIVLLLFGGFLMVSGLLSHDAWGFSQAYAAAGFVMVVVGFLLYGLARANANKGP